MPPRAQLLRAKHRSTSSTPRRSRALRTAREAADGKDVRVGGGASVVRALLAERLVDHAHLVQVPIVLGRGARVWDGLEDLQDAYDVEAVSSPSGVTHLTFTRRTGP